MGIIWGGIVGLDVFPDEIPPVRIKNTNSLATKALRSQRPDRANVQRAKE